MIYLILERNPSGEARNSPRSVVFKTCGGYLIDFCNYGFYFSNLGHSPSRISQPSSFRITEISATKCGGGVNQHILLALMNSSSKTIGHG